MHDEEGPLFLALRTWRRETANEKGVPAYVILHDATRIEDLRLPPSNQLERLTGNRQGQWSIRINGQWRVCFRFEGEHAFDVEIVDYH